ncbi:MAG: sugar phosphate isomerase/epimerase family protein [Armatimonadota bacterium]
MFRRALITDEVSQDPAVAIRLAMRFKLDGIEVRSVWQKGPHELTRDEVRTLRAMIRDAGLVVCVVATPCFKCSLDDPGEVRSHDEILKRCQDLCAELEAPIARIFTFWRREGGAAEAGIWSDRARVIAEHLTKAADIAESSGLRLGIENEPSVYGSNCARVADLLQRAGRPTLGVIWDPGNDVYDPDGERPFPDGYTPVAPHVIHVHIKDARRDPVTKTVSAAALGDGEVPYPAIFARLMADGYRGFLSLETHYRISGPLNESVTRLPRGAAFSAGGEEATELCLRRWDEMLRGAQDA